MENRIISFAEIVAKLNKKALTELNNVLGNCGRGAWFRSSRRCNRMIAIAAHKAVLKYRADMKLLSSDGEPVISEAIPYG